MLRMDNTSNFRSDLFELFIIEEKVVDGARSRSYFQIPWTYIFARAASFNHIFCCIVFDSHPQVCDKISLNLIETLYPYGNETSTLLSLTFLLKRGKPFLTIQIFKLRGQYL